MRKHRRPVQSGQTNGERFYFFPRIRFSPPRRDVEGGKRIQKKGETPMGDEKFKQEIGKVSVFGELAPI